MIWESAQANSRTLLPIVYFSPAAICLREGIRRSGPDCRPARVDMAPPLGSKIAKGVRRQFRRPGSVRLDAARATDKYSEVHRLASRSLIVTSAISSILHPRLPSVQLLEQVIASELSFRTSRTRVVRMKRPLGCTSTRHWPSPMKPGSNLAFLDLEPYNVTSTGSGQYSGWPLRSASHPSRASSRY
jgi:hypothetical protein